MILTLPELAELTGRTRRGAQARVLTHLGIPFKSRPDGSLVVFHHDIHATPPQKQPRAPALRLP